MGIKTVNIAAAGAMQCPAPDAPVMDKELATALINYRAAAALADSMLLRGIITEAERTKLCTVFAKKYGLSSFSIFC